MLRPRSLPTIALIAALAFLPAACLKAQELERSPADDCQSAPEAAQRIQACTDYIVNHHVQGRELIAALMMRAAAYNSVGSFDQAIADLNELLRVDKKNADALYSRGVMYANKGDYDRAIQDFDAAVAVNPKYASAFMNRGNAYRGKQDLDHAMQDFNQAIRLDPKLGDAYYDRGTAYYQKNDLDHAIEDFGQAIRLNPKDAGAFDNRGAAYAQKGDADRAIQDYSQAIRLNSADGTAFLNRGNAYNSKQDFASAIKDYGEAIRLNADTPELFYDLGNAYDNTGETARAIENYDKAISRNPSSEDALKARAFDEFVAGNFDKAADDFDALARIRMANVSYRVWLYVAEERSGADGTQELAAASSDPSFELWPGPVAQMMLDKADTAVVLAAVDKAGPADRQDQVCQAHFFFAQYHIIHQASPATVRGDLQTAEQTCPSRTVFRKSVEADLAKLASSK